MVLFEIGTYLPHFKAGIDKQFLFEFKIENAIVHRFIATVLTPMALSEELQPLSGQTSLSMYTK